MASRMLSRKVGYHGDEGAFLRLFMLPLGDEGDEAWDSEDTGTSALKRFRVDMTRKMCMGRRMRRFWSVVVARKRTWVHVLRVPATSCFYPSSLPTLTSCLSHTCPFTECANLEHLDKILYLTSHRTKWVQNERTTSHAGCIHCAMVVLLLLCCC